MRIFPRVREATFPSVSCFELLIGAGEMQSREAERNGRRGTDQLNGGTSGRGESTGRREAEDVRKQESTWDGNKHTKWYEPE